MKGEHYKMNSDDLDFLVSKAFGESDASWKARNRKMAELISDERSARQRGSVLNEELEACRNMRNAMDAYMNTMGWLNETLPAEGHALEFYNALNKRIEAIQTERTTLWNTIKEIQRQRRALG